MRDEFSVNELAGWWDDRGSGTRQAVLVGASFTDELNGPRGRRKQLRGGRQVVDGRNRGSFWTSKDCRRSKRPSRSCRSCLGDTHSYILLHSSTCVAISPHDHEGLRAKKPVSLLKLRDPSLLDHIPRQGSLTIEKR